MADVSKIKLPNGTTYDIKDENALPLTGGTVTGPVSFEDSVIANLLYLRLDAQDSTGADRDLYNALEVLDTSIVDENYMMNLKAALFKTLTWG